MLPIPGKVSESIVADRLKRLIGARQLLPDRQFGFRERHSTSHALMNFTSDVNRNLRNKETTVAVSLDVEKAFDTVWVMGLLYKLIRFDFPPKLVKFLHSYLTGRRFCVSVNANFSEEMDVSQGVPQGSVLGPILFTLFVSDVPTLSFTQLDMFADDTTLKGSSMHPSVAFSRAQAHLDVLHDYFPKWKIRVHSGKTKYIVFTRKKADLSTLTLNYGGTEIHRVDELKLLGMTIDRGLNFTSHVAKAISKANDVSRRLRPLLKRNSGLSAENKISIFKIFVRSVLTYGITIWNCTSRGNLNKVQVVQNKALRSELNLRPHPITFRQVPTAQVHQMADVETIGQFAERLTLQFRNRMVDHPNSLIDSLSQVTRSSLDRRHPFNIIRQWL